MSDISLSDAFLEQSPACHWIVDRSGVFQRIYGDPAPVFARSSAMLLGQSYTQALDPEIARTWKERTRRAFKGEVVRVGERHGDSIWNISIFPIRAGSAIRYAGALAREITAWSSAEQELRRTVLGALKAMDFKRNAVSRFLHDSIGQNLTAFGLQLDLLRMDVEPIAPQLCARIADMHGVLEEMIEAVREYSYDLNPSAVERAGLRSALDRLFVRMRERFTGTLRLNVDPSVKLDPKVAVPMYQIAQEAVENAVQHASCSMIEVALKPARAGNYLEVRDNGRGFDPADLQGGYRGLGLLSMEHYAAEGGLELTILSNRETGTRVRVAAPHDS